MINFIKKLIVIYSIISGILLYLFTANYLVSLAVSEGHVLLAALVLLFFISIAGAGLWALMEAMDGNIRESKRDKRRTY